MFLEQLYLRLGTFIFIYMLTFYIIFCFIIIIILIAFIYFYIFFIKICLFQTFSCILIGMNTFAIISILFVLSINNFCFIFLLFISTKKHIFNIYLTFHFFYSLSLLVLITVYYFFIVYNIFDVKYNENYFYINYVFFSFFNNFTIAICLSSLFLCIGAIPFTLGFYIKLFSFFIYLNYIGISILYFCVT